MSEQQLADSQLPCEWRWVAFEEVTQNFDGRRIPVKKPDRAKRSGQYPYYGASGIIDAIDDYLFDGDFLLVAEDGANLLSRSTPIAFHASDKFWVNNHAHVVKARDGISQAYLEYFLNSIDLKFYVTGTAQPKLTQANLNKIPVPLAPFNEQRQIVAEIEKQFTRLEAGVAGLRRVRANLKRYRAAVLKAACEGKLVPTEAELARQEGRTYETGAQLLERILTERRKKSLGKVIYKEPVMPDAAKLTRLPDGWAWTTLELLAGVVDPHPSHRTPPEVPGGVPYVGMGDVSATRRIDLAHARKVAHSVLAEHRDRYTLQRGDFFVGKIGTIGRPVPLQAPFDYILSANVVLIQPVISHTAPLFLFMYLDSPESERAFLSGSRATTQAAFGIQKFRLLPIPFAPLAEQQRIVAEVERRLSVVKELEAAVNANLQRATRLRQSILQRAFEGKLVSLH